MYGTTRIGILVGAMLISTVHAVELDDISQDFDRAGPDLEAFDVGGQNRLYIGHKIRATIHGIIKQHGEEQSIAQENESVDQGDGERAVEVCGVDAGLATQDVYNICIINTIVIE